MTENEGFDDDQEHEGPYPHRRLDKPTGQPQIKRRPGGPWVPDTSVEPPSTPANPERPPRKRRGHLDELPTVEHPAVKPPQKGPTTPPTGK